MTRAAAGLLLLACALTAPGEKTAAPSAFPTQERPAAPAPAPDTPKPVKGAPAPKLTVDEALEKLDLRARIAQLLVVTLQGGIAPNAQDMAFLKQFTPGAVIVRTAGLPVEAQAYVARLHAAEVLNGIPMLAGCDLYALSRADRMMPSQFVQLPSLLALAAAHDSGATDKFARLLAQHLRGMGFDFSLGPSLELAPVVHDAAGTIFTLGSSPDFAAEAGAAIVNALTSAGVAAAPLGFPGGGANRRENEPAVLLTSPEDLPGADLLPYARAIGAGAPIVHVGNTLVPTLDKAGPPASTCPAVYGVLREEFGFEGLALAGPIDGEDLATRQDPAEAAARALMAGADLLYFVTSLSTAARAVDKLAAQVEDGALPREAVDRAVRKVVAFKMARRDAAGESDPVKLSDAKALEKKGLADEAYAVERKSITLIKNQGGVLPLARDKSAPAGVTGVVGVELLVEMLRKPLKSVAQQPIASAKHLGEIQDFEIERLTAHAEGVNTAVVVLTDALRPYGQKKLVHALKAKGAKVVVVFLGYPGAVEGLLEADAILLAYCAPSSYGQTLRAVGDVLLGKAPVSLRADLSAIQLKAGEARRFNALDIVRAPAGRLPIALGDAFPAGFSVNYGGEDLLKEAQWDFGDGQTAKGLAIEHAYTAPGEYTLTVQAHTGKDESATQAYRVNVAP